MHRDVASKHFQGKYAVSFLVVVNCKKHSYIDLDMCMYKYFTYLLLLFNIFFG